MKTLKKVKIVEYHESLAKGIAKMWNESRQNWGGDSVVTTEQDVKEKEANSTNLHLFLAIVEDEVVGYCGLSEYKEDEGALYIPLLNVHPAFHSMKIGKQLVLKAVEKTVELKWPRLDLFTWAGNTKAVPLYKKCGFFWEDRDNTTHLMNFIPTVLQIDWLRPFFEKHDWYSTSQRPIEVKPDGIKENGHTFYEYKWKAGEEFVRIQVERTGRGLRLIETQDILVEMKLPEFKLLEKEEHFASYHVVNKTKTTLDISISGSSSNIIDHSFEEVLKVKNDWVGQYPLKLTMPPSDPSPWKTHPVVGVDILINGKLFPLKMGVFPKKAGKFQLRSVKKHWSVKQDGMLFLDIESQIEEDSTWTIQLPMSDVVKWRQSEVKTMIKGKTRVSIPIAIQLLKNSFLEEEVEVFVQRQSGQCFTFHTRLSLAFPGFGAKFGGETDEHWYGYNGPFYVKIEKRNHMVKIGSVRSNQDPITFFTPKIGKPFSEEFSKKQATSIEYMERSEAFVLKTTLKSDAFTPVLLNTYFKIYGDGLVEINHELVNEGKEDRNNIFLHQPLVIKLKGLAIPQKDGIMIGEEAVIPFMDYICDKDISENWIFTSSPEGETIGLAWPNDAKGRKDDWRFAIEYTTDNIPSEENVCFGPIHVGVNTTPNWSGWRELVVGEEVKSVEEYPLYALEEDNRDFISSVGEKVDYSFRSMLTPYVHGRLTLVHEGKTFVKEASKEDGVTKINLQLEHQAPGIKHISGNFHSPGQSAEVHSLQLVKGNQEVNVLQNEDGWSVENGAICFKASETFFPTIYSLTYKGNETLHHQYPQAGPKAWWNPWGGGLRYAFGNVNAYSMLKETTTIESVTKIDQHGHYWTGLCLSTTFTEHEDMKGVVLRQFALTLPEVPVVVLYAEIHQNSGRTFTKQLLELEAFFKPGKKLSSCYVSLPTKGVFHKYYAGVEEFVLRDTSHVTIGSEEREEKITMIYPNSKRTADVYLNQDVLLVGSAVEWSAFSGDIAVMKPTIMLFGDSNLSQFNQLQGLSFK